MSNSWERQTLFLARRHKGAKKEIHTEKKCCVKKGPLLREKGAFDFTLTIVETPGKRPSIGVVFE
jgi:hypothetical protein